MKRLLIVLLLASTAALAQQPVTPADKGAPLPQDQQASREDIARMFVALRLQSTLQNMQDTMMTNMEKLMDETVAKEPAAKLTPEQRRKLAEFKARNRDRARNLYPIKEMLDDFVPVYQRYFSKADVDAVVAFYSSPTGQHLLDAQPALMREGMAVLMPKLQDRMGKMIAQMRQEVDQIFMDDKSEVPPKKD